MELEPSPAEPFVAELSPVEPVLAEGIKKAREDLDGVGGFGHTTHPSGMMSDAGVVSTTPSDAAPAQAGVVGSAAAPAAADQAAAAADLDAAAGGAASGSTTP